jgi:signal transduction histidine kinase
MASPKTQTKKAKGKAPSAAGRDSSRSPERRAKAGAGSKGLEAYEELKSLKDVLLTSRNKLSAVFDSIPDPVLSLTPEGAVESLNMALARRAGAHPRDLVGLTGEELLERAQTSPSTIHLLKQALAELKSQGSAQYRLIETPGDEGPEYWEVSFIPVQDAEGRHSLTIIHTKDVTIFKRMEQTIREYSHSLEEMVAERTKDLLAARNQLQRDKESLAKANKDLRLLEVLRHDLTNMVVHDLKGPLAEIMGNLELLSFEPLTENQTEALELASLGADDLLRMIMNLLDIDRLEEKEFQINRELVSFRELAEPVCGKFQALIRFKELQAEIVDQTQNGIYADPEILARALQNLLSNAFAHTPEGGWVRIMAQDQDDGVVIEVADSGEGIAKHLQHRIFRKFTQAYNHKGPRTSTGLGLAFCKMAVEAHGGTIWLESDEGKGARFFLWLPGAPA